jgi:GNAT superfamily N-acetyltransferase
VERWATYAVDAPPLWALHYTEVAIDQEVIPLDMDLERYAALDAADVLHIVTMRTVPEQALVGYQTSLVSGHLHYKSTLVAAVDLYYVLPAYRQGWAGVRLFREAERTLKARGVVKIARGTKLHAGLDMTRLFQYLGYRTTEQLLTKLL